MKKIKLTRGKFALVDDNDFKYLSQWKWMCVKKQQYTSITYYAGRHNKGGSPKFLRMHQAILGKRDGFLIDHEDGDGLNNQRSNLRFCTNTQNIRNQKPRENFTSKYKGVAWRADRQKWCAYVCPDRKKINLGCYTKEIDAAKAYDVGALKHFGEFARLNFNTTDESVFSRKTKKGKSKYLGVSKHSKNNSYVAIMHDPKTRPKTRYVGSFKTEIEAAKARDIAVFKRFGKDAKLNFPEVIYA